MNDEFARAMLGEAFQMPPLQFGLNEAVRNAQKVVATLERSQRIDEEEFFRLYEGLSATMFYLQGTLDAFGATSEGRDIISNVSSEFDDLNPLMDDIIQKLMGEDGFLDGTALDSAEDFLRITVEVRDAILENLPTLNPRRRRPNPRRGQRARRTRRRY